MVSAVPRLGPSTIARSSGCPPGIPDVGESTQSKPTFEALANLPRAVELDVARANRSFQRKISHEDASHRSQVGRNVETDLESRIGRTKIDLFAVAHEPPPALR